MTARDAAALEDQILALTRYARSLTRDPDDAVQTCLERAIKRFELFRRRHESPQLAVHHSAQ